ncbi:NAD(P)-binding protein [Thozetella sp. PMI_491]|nr:NAD(P)-binding protein [Thozetella sp. PMI_491]
MATKGWDHLKDIPDLSGRVAVVTGGSGGLGEPTVAFLAKAGAKVYLSARNQPKAERAVENIHVSFPGIPTDRIVPLPIDLEDIGNIVAGAARLRAAETRLDLLIHNGALPGGRLDLANTGIQVAMAVNCVGLFVLTQELQPLLTATAREPGSDVRVITLSSKTQNIFVPADYQPNFRDPAGGDFINPGSIPASEGPLGFFPAQRQYGVTKLAATIIVSELQARYDADGLSILSICLEPDTTRTTTAWASMPFWMKPLLPLISVLPVQGCKNTLFLATAPVVRAQDLYYKGRFVGKTGDPVAPHPAARNSVVAKELWTSVESLVKAYREKHGV